MIFARDSFCMNHYHVERYRSGHNGAVLKTVRVQAHMGSNPILSAIHNQTQAVSFKESVFLLPFLLEECMECSVLQ